MGFVANWEDDLIPPEKWDDLYEQMPGKCQQVVNDVREGKEFCIGIGRNYTLGWFIGCTGQGPFLAWTEKRIRQE
jgi:hypothetical protein